MRQNASLYIYSYSLVPATTNLELDGNVCIETKCALLKYWSLIVCKSCMIGVNNLVFPTIFKSLIIEWQKFVEYEIIVINWGISFPWHTMKIKLILQKIFILWLWTLEHNNTEHHKISREVFQLENTLIICINLF